MNTNKKTESIVDISLPKAALVAGLGYLVIFIFGAFFGVLENLIVWGDAATTADNIMASELLFHTVIAGLLIVIVADVVVAWALYVFLKPVSKNLSLLTAWFRLVFGTIFGIALLSLLSASQLLSGSDYLTVFESNQLYAQAMIFLKTYQYGLNIGYVFFGLHILGLGYLIFKSDYVPSILGALLIITSVGYLIDSFASFLSSNYANNETLFFIFVAVPAIISEFSLTLWLLIKGRKVGQRDNRAPAL